MVVIASSGPDNEDDVKDIQKKKLKRILQILCGQKIEIHLQAIEP